MRKNVIYKVFLFIRESNCRILSPRTFNWLNLTLSWGEGDGGDFITLVFLERKFNFDNFGQNVHISNIFQKISKKSKIEIGLKSAESCWIKGHFLEKSKTTELRQFLLNFTVKPSKMKGKTWNYQIITKNRIYSWW